MYPLSFKISRRSFSPFGSLSQSWQQMRLWLLLLALSTLSACAPSEAQSASPDQAKRPVPVVAATVTRSLVPLLFNTTGNAQAYATVAVQSQVAGQLTGVYFREGQAVKQGDLLFTIDSRTLQATVAQAEANRAKAIAQVGQAKAQLAQAKAQAAEARANVTNAVAQANNADVQARRYNSLLSEGAVTNEQADQLRTTAESQRATVAANQSAVGNADAAVNSAAANVQTNQAAVSAADADVANAKVQLSYASIYAPSEGRLGKLNVDQGNLVTANNTTTPLVTISQIRPIYVGFSIPQRLLPELKQYQAQGNLRVEAKPAQGNGSTVQGQLVFVDSGVDPATGTIQLKASFANAEGRLTPGQFVNVSLRLTEEPNAIVVPTPAIQTGQQGSFVYLIKPDKTVEARPVTTGQSVTTGQNATSQTVIKSGLRAGDRVVVDGQFNLAPGAQVQESASASGSQNQSKNQSQSQPQSKPQ